ncbi:thiol:disulfide interchange protein, partial [Salmonella enterica subsp. enterica serovar Typhimurium]
CLNIIKSHFQVASTIPLQGTPTMVTLSGKPQLFTGWLSPENLVTQMGAAQK